jgi:uncharacterized membrane protein|tara:strand:- start:1333 stop:1575 length:243 start_codon:yes stop_codon:yes gene_type:complete
LIFSLLKLRKKTAAVVGGISTGALCLWALVMWQNVSVEELTGLLLNTLLMLVMIIVTALLIIVAFKGLAKIAKFIINKLE